jgi:hypothetical protein
MLPQLLQLMVADGCDWNRGNEQLPIAKPGVAQSPF